MKRKKLQEKYILLLCGTSQTPIPNPSGIIIHSDTIFQKDPLHEAHARLDFHSPLLPGVVGDFGQNMSLIVRIKVVAVNDSHRIVELQTVFEAQAAPGV